MKYKATKTVDLPEYVKFDIFGKNIKMKLSTRRTFTYNASGDTFDLEDNECFYQTIYGWGVIVDYNTFRVIKNEHDIFSDMYPTKITKKEYGDGVW